MACLIRFDYLFRDQDKNCRNMPQNLLLISKQSKMFNFVSWQVNLILFSFSNSLIWLAFKAHSIHTLPLFSPPKCARVGGRRGFFSMCVTLTDMSSGFSFTISFWAPVSQGSQRFRGIMHTCTVTCTSHMSLQKYAGFHRFYTQFSCLLLSCFWQSACRCSINLAGWRRL